MSRLQYIKENYKNLSDEDMAVAEGVSPAYIKAIRDQHGLNRYESDCRNWSEADRRALKKLYPTSSWQDIYERFPNRTHGAIVNQAGKLGLNRETIERRTVTEIPPENRKKKNPNKEYNYQPTDLPNTEH